MQFFYILKRILNIANNIFDKKIEKRLHNQRNVLNFEKTVV